MVFLWTHYYDQLLLNTEIEKSLKEQRAGVTGQAGVDLPAGVSKKGSPGSQR
jgi:hypothetical protein